MIAEQPSTIEIEDVSVSYDQRCVLRQVSLQVQKGKVMALVGPSGCGKSSLLQSVNRLTDLVAGCRVEGLIKVGGQDVRAPDVNLLSLRRRMGFIFQNPQPFPFSIRKNMELPLVECCDFSKEQRQAVIERTFKQVGLWDEVKDRLDKPATSLSGGQQQRLCIARALALEPKVLLLDEPCSALDPIASRVVEELIGSLKQSYTILMVTHNLSQARRIADDVAVFWVRDGVGLLLENGSVAQIFDHPKEALTQSYVQGFYG